MDFLFYILYLKKYYLTSSRSLNQPKAEEEFGSSNWSVNVEKIVCMGH